MPLARIRYSTDITEETLKALQERLPRAIATNFTCGDAGGGLTADDIELYFDAQSYWDVTPYPLVLDVEMREFPSRRADLTSRTRSLWLSIEEIVSNDVTFGLWVKLALACWVDDVS
jgi:hypothetical protein